MLSNSIYFRGLLRKHGYTMGDMAIEVGLGRTQFSNRANCVYPWEWPIVQKMCKLLDITLDEFAAYYPLT